MPMLTTLLMRLPVCLPRAAADPLGEVGHLVEHGVHLGHDVLAVDHDRSRRAAPAARRARRLGLR